MLMLKTLGIQEHTRECLIDCLYYLSSSLNCDFNGDNGEEYTSDEALEKGFESDLEYYADMYKDLEEEEFLTTMINCMCNYADDWEIEFIYDEEDDKKTVTGVAVALYDKS